MSRFKQHLNERRKHDMSKARSKIILADDALEGIKKNCKQAINAYKKGIRVYRGTPTGESVKAKYLYVEPSKHKRKSANTSNVYTMILDNHPDWKKYPKRSESIICTNNLAGAYGRAYVVFTKDRSNYGVCSSSDMWDSFTKGLKGRWLDSFNEEIVMITERLAMDSDRVKKIVNGSDYNKLKEMFEEMDIHIYNGDIDLNKWGFPWTEKYHGDFLALVWGVLDPDLNGFYQTRDPMKLPKYDVGSRELWTDGDAYMVHWRTMEELEKLL